jgi:ribose transport system substrate-binding protein
MPSGGDLIHVVRPAPSKATSRQGSGLGSRLRAWIRLGVLASAVASVVAACASSGTVGSTGTSAKSTGANSKLASSFARIEKGTFRSPPTTGPKAGPGKNIWLVTQATSAENFQAPGSMYTAAKDLGWHVTEFNGNYSPNTVVSGLEQAVADHADGIILAFVDCADVKSGLDAARRAHIPVVSIEASDCNEAVNKQGVLENTGQPKLFSAQVSYVDPSNPSQSLDYDKFISIYGREDALATAVQTHGQAKVIVIRETDYTSTLLEAQGFATGLREYCRACQIVDTINITGTDIGSPLQQMVSQALAQHPTANAVFTGYDALTLDVAPAVLASGRQSSIFVLGGEGTAPVVQLIREARGVNAAIGYSVKWEAWAALDAMNRLLNGEKPPSSGFPTGMGIQYFDKSHELPSAGSSYVPPVNFSAAYLKAWGIKG